MTVEGEIIEKFDTQSVTDTFRKREFVLQYAENPQYPEYLKFELIQANCEQLDQVNQGDQVTVNFNLKGRKWTDPSGQVKYFNSLQAWKIEKNSASASSPADMPPPPAEEPTWTQNENVSEDDLPF